MVLCSTKSFRSPNRWRLHHLQHMASNFALGTDSRCSNREEGEKDSMGGFMAQAWKSHIPLAKTQSHGHISHRKIRKRGFCVLRRRRNGFGEWLTGL